MSKAYQVYEKAIRRRKYKVAYQIMNKHFKSFPLYDSSPSIADLYAEVSQKQVELNQKKGMYEKV